jgi:hypothetical protein
MKDEDEVPRKNHERPKRTRKPRMYRLGSQGLEDMGYEYEHGDDEDDNDLSDSVNEGGDGAVPGNDGIEVMEVEQDREEPEVDDLEAAGFRLDPEDIMSDADEEDKNDEKELNKVQICELHSQRPFVLFRGKYYDCQWASNIGTEMLFMKHDPDDLNPLPSLRTLQGDVDLLAASSARIMSKEVNLVPKVQESQKIRRPGLKAKDLAIEVGRGAGRERKEQAKFLEELINTKLAMGELDAVTVDAVGRKSIWKWKEYFKQEVQRLKKVIRKGGKDAVEAATKLRALEEEVKRREASKGSQKRKGVPGGAPKPQKGRSALGKLREPTPANFGTPSSGVGSMAPPSPGDFDSDETEDSDLDDDDNELEDSEEGGSEEGDSEEGTEREDSEGEDTEQGDSDEGDSGEEQSSDEEGFPEEDENDEGDEDTNMYG